MRNLYLFFMLVFLSCENTTKLYPYNYTLQYDELNSQGNGYRIATKTDTVMAPNDMAAYKKVLMAVEGRRIASKMVSQKIIGDTAHIYLFTVSDSLGNSVPNRLGSIVIDSINAEVSGVISDYVINKLLY